MNRIYLAKYLRVMLCNDAWKILKIILSYKNLIIEWMTKVKRQL